MSSHVSLDPAEQCHSGDSVCDMTLGKKGTRDLSMGVGGKKSHISKMTVSHQLMPCDKGVLLGFMSFCRDTLVGWLVRKIFLLKLQKEVVDTWSGKIIMDYLSSRQESAMLGIIKLPHETHLGIRQARFMHFCFAHGISLFSKPVCTISYWGKGY